MNTMLKRLLSLAIALTMVIGLMPWNVASVYATEAETEATQTPEETTFTCTNPNHDHTNETVTWTAWDGTGNLTTAGHYYLEIDGDSVSRSGGLTVKTDIVLDLNGKTMNVTGASFRIYYGEDSTVLTIQNGAFTYKAGVTYTNDGAFASMGKAGAKLYVSGMTVDGNGTTSNKGNGGLIHSNKTDNVIGIKNSTFKNFTTTGYGGAINLYGGTATLENVNFESCAAVNGGAIAARNSATMTLTNCNFTGCTSTYTLTGDADADINKGGGALLVGGGATVTMNGGTITGSVASCGEGVAVRVDGNSTFNLAGGQITENKAENATSAVYIAEGSTFNMTGGTISNNTYLGDTKYRYEITIDGTATISGGTIYGGKETGSEKYNRTLFAAESADVTIEDGAAIYGIMYGEAASALKITGGEFWKAYAGAHGTFGYSTITGGTFHYTLPTDAESIDLAEGYVQNPITGKVVAACTEHSYESVVTAPTCTADGYTTYTCSVCGDSYTGDVVTASGEHSWGEGAETKAPTCTEAGEMTYTCSVCGETKTEEILPAGEHSYGDGVQTKAPTCEEDGEMTYTCTACGDSYTEAVDATGHTDGVVCGNCGQMNAQAGVALVLDEDLTVAELTIPADVILDLNGHTLTVESLVSFGDIIDTAGNGLLVAGTYKLAENSYLPIYDSQAGGYRFFDYTLKNLGVRAAESSAVFGFALEFKNAAAYELLANSADANIDVVMTLAWGESEQAFAFNAELIREYAALQVKYPALRSAMLLTVTGLDTLESGTALTVMPAVSAADGQLSSTGEAMTYTR